MATTMVRRFMVPALVLAGALVLALMLVSPVAAKGPPPGKGPGGGGGGGTEQASIRLIQCDGKHAQWQNSDGTLRSPVTFSVVDKTGKLSSSVTEAVERGVQNWNDVGSFYQLTPTSGTADISIELFFKVTGGILGFADVNCKGDDSGGIQSVRVVLGVKGLKPIGIENLAAHEIGHALANGHASKKGDLMDPRFEQKEEGKKQICPSNLDRYAQLASGDIYSIPGADWKRLPC